MLNLKPIPNGPFCSVNRGADGKYYQYTTTTVLAIDPGPMLSGASIGLLYDHDREHLVSIFDHTHADNLDIIQYIRNHSCRDTFKVLVMEAPTGNAQKLSSSLRDTIFWYGRFFEAWDYYHEPEDQGLVVYTPSALRSGLLGDNKRTTAQLLQHIRGRWGVKRGVTPEGRKVTDHELIAAGLIYLFMKRKTSMYE